MTGIVPAGPYPQVGFKSGNYIQAIPANIGAAAAMVAGHIALCPFEVRAPVTINGLALRVTTGQASANLQMAIYAHSLSTGYPTGAALASTASFSGVTSQGVGASITALSLVPGFIYWGGVNSDTSAVVVSGPGNGNANYANLLGSPTLANMIGPGSQALLGVDVAQAFNTWPDLTGGSFTEQQGSTFTGAMPLLKVA